MIDVVGRLKGKGNWVAMKESDLKLSKNVEQHYLQFHNPLVSA